MATPKNMNTNFLVKNLRGTSSFKCQCGSWIAHWRKGARSQRGRCAVVGCQNSAEVGAHVQSVDRRTDERWWIAPFCRAHNIHTNDQFMFLDSRVTLVAADRKLTCNNPVWP